MSFEVRVKFKTRSDGNPQQEKLNQLVEQIEQRKAQLHQWQQAKTQIQSYQQQILLPVYRDLLDVWFQQLELLWQALTHDRFSAAELAYVDVKIQSLLKVLQQQSDFDQNRSRLIDQVSGYYAQVNQPKKVRKNKPLHVDDLVPPVVENTQVTADDDLWLDFAYAKAREQAKQKRLQQKKAEAQAKVNQSIKTVYLKIASSVHPDREPDENKKIEKTDLLQRANSAYEQDDLFQLLKLQLEVEQLQQGTQKRLSAEQYRYHQQALEEQKIAVEQQIQVLVESLAWSDAAKITIRKSKNQFDLQKLFRQVDTEVSMLKQQLKHEKRRWLYMQTPHGLAALVEQQLL